MPPRGKRKKSPPQFYRVDVQTILDFASVTNLEPTVVGVSFWRDISLEEVLELQRNNNKEFQRLVDFYQPFIPRKLPKLPEPPVGWWEKFLKENDLKKMGLPILPTGPITLSQLSWGKTGKKQ